MIKPVEIDDVPIVTLTLRSPTADSYTLRRVAEEVTQRLAVVENVSRAYVVGGEPRTVHVRLDPDRMRAHNVSPLEIQQALAATNVNRPAGTFTADDDLFKVATAGSFTSATEIRQLVVGVFADRPVFLKDVASVVDGPEEVTSYVRHGWGPARGFDKHHGVAGSLVGSPAHVGAPVEDGAANAVTIALAKKQGTNAVWVAQDVIAAAEALKRSIVPDDMELVITRNYGLTADEKVNELVEALAVAIVLVIAVLTLGLGSREAFIVAVAVPVVFGLTLLVNLLFGFTINRVTLFALILSLGLLVDDPIVDVENISRHFALRGRGVRSSMPSWRAAWCVCGPSS